RLGERLAPMTSPALVFVHAWRSCSLPAGQRLCLRRRSALDLPERRAAVSRCTELAGADAHHSVSGLPNLVVVESVFLEPVLRLLLDADAAATSATVRAGSDRARDHSRARASSGPGAGAAGDHHSAAGSG